MSIGHFKMKFIADDMLGKLATWLRISGFDTIYINHVKDAELVRLSVHESRILLTRDTILSRKKGLKNFLFIVHDKPFEQLRQVVKEFHLSPPVNPFSRCIRCNTALSLYPKEDACRIVPEYVCKTQSVFGQCPSCHKLYWKGTHYEKMEKVLSEIFGPGE
ncbi:MAG: Mut7-C RNAse domain-containing protein [Nitrospira sp.]|nr:Mut7-C RNAse domain-containing protein [Nitrospira sp.]